MLRTCSSFSGSNTNTRQRESSGAVSSKLGFSVVAPISVMIPFSTQGRNASCCARLRSEEHTSELQSQSNLVCRLLLDKKKSKHLITMTHNPISSLERHTIRI